MSNPYAPPVAQEAERPETLAAQIPGVSKSIAVKQSGLWSGVKIYVDGVEAPKSFWGKFTVKADDGRELHVRYGAGLNGPFLLVNKERYPFGPRTSTALGLLVFAPLFLMAIGGAIGGLFGGGGMLLNRRIVQSNRGSGVKAGLMLVVLVVSTLGTFLVAGVATLLIRGDTP